jgi:DNA polymerase-3 subunit delta
MNLSENKRYYIAGTDFFLENETKKILGKLEDCDIEYYNDDINLESFFSFINSPSIFNDCKAAVVRSGNKIKNLDELISKCSSCLESIIIVTNPETKILKKLSTALKDAEFEQIVEKKATKYDMTGRIASMFSDAGFRIDSASAMELNEIFEGDLKQVSNEIEKLTLYFAYKKPQSPAEIMKAVTARKHDTIFKFIDAYTVRRKKECMLLLSSFISHQENLAVLINLLFKRMKDVYLYGISRELVTEKRPFLLDKIKSGTRSWKESELVKLNGTFAELDYMVKTGQVNMENYLTRLISLL